MVADAFTRRDVRLHLASGGRRRRNQDRGGGRPDVRVQGRRRAISKSKPATAVELTYGSSGNFFAQIQNGAPFDLFFSADVGYPQKLEAAGLAEPGTMYEYASGKLVMWVPNASKLDLSRGLAALLDPGIRKIAIANPQHAPYGTRGGRGDAPRRDLRPGQKQTRARRKYLADRAVRSVRQRRRRPPRALARGRAGDEGQRTLRRNPGGGLSAAHPGRRDSEIVAQQGAGEPVSEISQGARNRGADGAIRFLDSQGRRRGASTARCPRRNDRRWIGARFS